MAYRYHIKAEDSNGTVYDLFTRNKEPTELSLTFDQNMNPFVAFVEDGQAWFWWYDPQQAQQVFTQMAPDVVSPRATLDDKRDFASVYSNIRLCYIRNGSLYYRRQDERYQTEHLLTDNAGDYLYDVNMASNDRLEWILSRETGFPETQLRITMDSIQRITADGKKRAVFGAGGGGGGPTNPDIENIFKRATGGVYVATGKMWVDDLKTVLVKNPGDKIRIWEPTFGTKDAFAPDISHRPTLGSQSDTVEFDGSMGDYVEPAFMNGLIPVGDQIQVPPYNNLGTLLVATTDGVFWGDRYYSNTRALDGASLNQTHVVGFAQVDTVLTPAEVETLTQFFEAKGATRPLTGHVERIQYKMGFRQIGDFDISATTSHYATWAENDDALYGFPMLDFSSATALRYAWAFCQALSTFPAINTANVERLEGAWKRCQNLNSFPQLDTSKVWDFRSAWHGCYSLTSFPTIDTSGGQEFEYTWAETHGLSGTFPALNFSSARTLRGTWQESAISSFPSVDLSNAIEFAYTWFKCSNLTSFPFQSLQGSAASNYFIAWNRTSLDATSVDGILVTIRNNAVQFNLYNGSISLSNGPAGMTDGSTTGYNGIQAAQDLRDRGWFIENYQ